MDYEVGDLGCWVIRAEVLEAHRLRELGTLALCQLPPPSLTSVINKEHAPGRKIKQKAGPCILKPGTKPGHHLGPLPTLSSARLDH